MATTLGNVASISDNGGSSHYTPSQIGAGAGAIVSTPEPGSLALMGLGAAAMAVARRKK